MSGTFTLQFDGQTTSDLDFDISADKMEAALQDLSTVNDVSVTREVVAHGFTWLVTFNKMAYAGDLAAELTASGVGIFPSSTAAVSVESLRHIIGRLPYHTIVTGLTSVPHFFRVSSYSENGVGDSTPAYFGTPDTVSLTPSTQVPMPPKNATVSVTTSSSVTVLWEAPQSTGGNAITSYTVEWDILDSFNSVCAAGDCKDLTVLGSGTSSTTSYVIEDLVPGQEYFVRVKATSASGSGQVTLALPSPIRPAAVPEAPHAVVLLTDNDATLRVEFAEPEAVAPFGSNGAPIERYKIEWAQRVHEVQKITIQSIAGAITGRTVPPGLQRRHVPDAQPVHDPELYRLERPGVGHRGAAELFGGRRRRVSAARWRRLGAAQLWVRVHSDVRRALCSVGQHGGTDV